MKSSFSTLLALVCLPLLLWTTSRRASQATHPARKAGTVIILNGPSAAGKSSIQKEFQSIASELYLAMGLDASFCGVIPAYYFTGAVALHNAPQEALLSLVSTQDDHGPLHRLVVGHLGRQVLNGMHAAIAAYASMGNNVIVDYIAYESDWLPALMRQLIGYNVYVVGVRIPLETLEERERNRATTPIGHARSHYETVHQIGVYDCEIDTSIMNAHDAAQVIYEYIHNNKPRAARLIAEQDTHAT